MTSTQENDEANPVDNATDESWVDEPTPDVSASPDEDEAQANEAPDPVAEMEKWKDVAARAQADLDNFRKRMAREK